MKSIGKQRADHDWRNRLAARIILANPQKHGGEGSLAVKWARLYFENLNQSTRGTKRCA